ncbi:hypothetical protein FPV67DRAFT_1481671 [Lyophyllum atratum]|nr:hypothetical protein FPV67DRAFT_1481671 [Lyophyllum atratum]
MAAPTQEYPPWLTPVPSVIFDGNGIPITTSTTVLYLPLTYYGPSIPLNPDWTYGGLTSPASTNLPSTSSGISITTTAIPSSLPTTLTASTSSTLPTSSTSAATPTSFPSSVSLSTSSLTSIPSASSTPSSAPVGSAHLSRGQLIGVIIASILGVILIFILGILMFLCCKGRRNRRDEEPSFTPVARGVNDSFEIVGADGRTTWAERSPRHSGEEGDTFLRRSGAGTPTQPPDPEMGGRSVVPPYVGIPRVPVPGTGSQSSGGSSATNHSGYGTLIERPTLNLLPSTAEELDRQRVGGQILSPEELQRLDQEHGLPENADYSPLLPPPRLIDPDLGWGLAPKSDLLPFAHKSSQSSISAYPDADEAATLLTARRVRAEDLTPRSPPRLTHPLRESSSHRNSGGLFHSLGLDRLSWFKNIGSSSQRNSRTNSFLASPLSDDDLEIGVALLGPGSPEMSETQTSRRLGLGLGFDGERPVSTASARSVATIYHDAHSSLPGTPVSGGTPLAPLPRALTPSRPAPQQSGWPSSSTVAFAAAPHMPDLPATSHSYSTSTTHVNHGLSLDYDILDTPAPASVSPFASSATSSMSSLRETTTGSSYGISAHPFPPGLSIVPNKSWTDESSTITHIGAPVSILSNQDTAAQISIDVLEEEPPVAGEGWRSLAAEQGVMGRRTTFGQFVPPPAGLSSEEASLYSMRTHLSPTHSRSTGSAPASSRRDLSGSASSRPSAFSVAAHTHSSSGGHSLAYSGSISSDLRKRGSPAMSAFGPRSRSPTAVGGSVLSAPPTAHFVPERAGTHRMVASLDMDDLGREEMSSPEPTSPLSQLSSAPWAAGLDSNWTPA